jgi:hypothetical protein
MEATDVALDPVAPRVAVKQLYAGVPDPDGNPWFLPLARRAEVRCLRAVRLADLGADATSWPGWDVGVLSTGWGSDRKRDAIIVLGRRANGTPVWNGLLYTTTEFEFRGSP